MCFFRPAPVDIFKACAGFTSPSPPSHPPGEWNHNQRGMTRKTRNAINHRSNGQIIAISSNKIIKYRVFHPTLQESINTKEEKGRSQVSAWPTQAISRSTPLRPRPWRARRAAPRRPQCTTTNPRAGSRRRRRRYLPPPRKEEACSAKTITAGCPNPSPRYFPRGRC